MQRQSLGSPGRAIAKDDAVLKTVDHKRRDSSPSSISPAGADVGDDEFKPEKPLRTHSHPEKYIHLIPILIVLCFIILYISSHEPSPKDLAQFNRFNHREKITDSTDIDDFGRVHPQVFAIRSLRNLQEEIQRDTPKSRSHRKIGDF